MTLRGQRSFSDPGAGQEIDITKVIAELESADLPEPKSENSHQDLSGNSVMVDSSEERLRHCNMMTDPSDTDALSRAQLETGFASQLRNTGKPLTQGPAANQGCGMMSHYATRRDTSRAATPLRSAFQRPPALLGPFATGTQSPEVRSFKACNLKNH